MDKKKKKFIQSPYERIICCEIILLSLEEMSTSSSFMGDVGLKVKVTFVL